MVYVLSSLGDVGVGMFFFFSGYGNYSSIRKDDNKLDASAKRFWKWFWKRVKKTILIFLMCYIVVGIVNIVLYDSNASPDEMIKGVLTLTLPGTTTWYLKIQLLFYVITLISVLSFGISKSVWIVLILSIVYAVSMYRAGFATFWWHTSLCYSVGYLFGEKEGVVKECCFSRASMRILLISSGLIAGFGWLSGEFLLYGRFALRLIAMTIMTTGIAMGIYILPYRNVALSALIGRVGKASLPMYLVHISIVSYCFSSGYIDSKMLASFMAVTVLATIFVYITGELLVKKLCRKY